MKLSTEDRRELEKYAKHLAVKSTQVIVQSRLGFKVVTDCYPEPTSTSWSWFNLNISDEPQIYAETKRVLSGKLLAAHLPLCVEISLRTAEGDPMAIETWCLGLSPEKCEPEPKIVKKIYKRIQYLLKTLLSITRIVPGYKMSRIQDPDSYFICYLIYMGEPQEGRLGKDCKHIQIDEICTPIGTFQLSVSFRTELTISSTQTVQYNDIIKTDQVNTIIETDVEKEDDDDSSEEELTDFMQPGPFVDPARIKTLDDFKQLLIPDVPAGWLLKEPEKKKPADTERGDKETEEYAVTTMQAPVEPKTVEVKDDDLDQDSFEKYIPLNLPFATRTPYTELGDFMREIKKPETLEGFGDDFPPDATEVAKQLELFEAVAVVYNELADSLHKSHSESPDSN